jgi:hypothetical protein
MRRLATVVALTAALAGVARAEISDLLRSQLSQAAMQRAPGAEPVDAPLGGFLGSRQSVTQFVTLQAGRCYTVLGVGGQGVADLDIVLYNPNGKRVASDIGFDPTPMVQHCAQWPGAYKIEATVSAAAAKSPSPSTRRAARRRRRLRC